MTLTDKISHAAERKAFETILDNLIKKGQTQDAGQIANDLVNMVQKLHSDVWSEASFTLFLSFFTRLGAPSLLPICTIL